MKNGIPSKSEVLNILKTELYKNQKKFNDLFLEKFHNELIDYKNKWVTNPLWQWSRIYEYPFVESKINHFIKNNKNIKILDAGSGITFLPYKLSDKQEIKNIVCVDYDKELQKTYESISYNKVNFVTGSLDKLDFEDNAFDIVYCISVLEHTDNYDKIVQEFRRVIKNGGLLIITFDIGISIHHKLNLENSNRLLSLINEVLPIEEVQPLIGKVLNNVWTTKKANKLDEKLLPYRKQSLYKKLKNRILGRENFPNLTFYVLSSIIKK